MTYAAPIVRPAHDLDEDRRRARERAVAAAWELVRAWYAERPAPADDRDG